jgi:flagellar biosynthesis regulator FlaF
LSGARSPQFDRPQAARAAGTAIRDRVDAMQKDWTTLCTIVEELRLAANQLDDLLGV